MRRAPSQINVMVMDADPLVHVGLETILDQCPGIQLVGKARTYQEAFDQLKETQPHILLTEVTLPDRSGTDACREILEAFPNVRVLFFTNHQEKTTIFSSVLAGASGYLLKESARDRLPQMLELIADGHSVFGQDTLQEIQNLISQPDDPQEQWSWSLSPQQSRVVELVAEGKTNKEIGQALALSERTVRNYLAAVFKKLHVTHRSRVTALFYQSRMEN